MEARELVPCRTDPDAYFAEGVRPARARELCAGCGYLEACRAYVLDNPELYGVWGGTTRRERQGVRRRAAEGDRGPPWCRGVVRRARDRPGPPGVGGRPGRQCARPVTGRSKQQVTETSW
ncbi:WhiB family transcriptional regulator [Streptomyces dengpaensis]|uniref:Transcriptional regulator WhiB n=1 Tax=Streptomyces dengpaensis TaxID=2049881 RepID=A0ABM6T2F6_9ACTN|nr:WhiB family transcriptional regulator [Streptomyces dengpaensis]